MKRGTGLVTIVLKNWFYKVLVVQTLFRLSQGLAAEKVKTSLAAWKGLPCLE
jgi:hypothetical protein